VYALRYIKAGAGGYLSKLSAPDEIQHALEIMMRDGKYTSSAINNKIIDSFMLKKSHNPLEELSQREMEIALLLVQGYGNLEISNELNLKATTVSTYKTRVFEKLGITNLPALIEKFNLYSEKA
jgi:DNA-binding NarL/FixJ family response regulator